MTREITDLREKKLAVLYTARREVERLDAAWFEALDRGENGKVEREAHRAARADYRNLETALRDEGVTETCGRCGGDGCVHYGNVWFTRNGMPDRTCFACGGVGRMALRKYKFAATAPTRKKRRDAFLAKKAAEAAAADAKFAAFAAEHAAEAAVLAGWRGEEGRERARALTDEREYRWADMLVSFAASAEKYGSLTEKMLAVLTRHVEAEAEKLTAADFPTGKATVEAELVGTKLVESVYGRDTKGIYALRGEHAGNRVFGTIPRKLYDALHEYDEAGNWIGRNGFLVGSVIRFTAEFDKRDDHFGFFRRPTKVEVLSTGTEEE